MSEEKLEIARGRIFQLTVQVSELETKLSQATERTRCDVLKGLLPIIDSFELANMSVPSNCQDNIVLGFQQIHKQFADWLKRLDIKEIPTDTFDVSLHEAIDTVSSDNLKSGDIAEVVEKGYHINDIILRIAKVKLVK